MDDGGARANSRENAPRRMRRSRGSTTAWHLYGRALPCSPVLRLQFVERHPVAAGVLEAEAPWQKHVARVAVEGELTDPVASRVGAPAVTVLVVAAWV